MKFLICFVALVALEVNSIPVNETISNNNHIPSWHWKDIIPDDVIIKPDEPQPEAHPKRDPNGRIYNGREITEKEMADFKFQVRLIAHKKDSLFGCGGTIISPNTVLTAAHCVDQATKMELYFGVRNVKDIENGKIQSQIVDLSAFKTPPTWRPLGLVDDIAIIILPKPITFSATVGSIDLPSETKDTCPGYTGKTMNIFGWGKINDMGDRSDILKTSVVDIDAGKKCKSIFSYLFNENKMICADGSKATGTCKGDSGGPITINDGSKMYLTGVVSYGTNNCATTEPRVYTCVVSHLAWVKETMK